MVLFGGTGAPVPPLQPGVPSDPVVDANGGVTVQVFASADMGIVRRLLNDPRARGALQPSVQSVEVLGKEGACTRLRTTVEGLTTPLVYESTSCPTATGWRDTMTQSTDLNAYESSWTLTAVPGGTQVAYRCRVDVDLPIPSFMVRNGQVKSMVGTLLRLVDRLK